MTNIRRHYVPESAVFITAVCQQRKPLLELEEEKNLLLSIMRKVKLKKPFSMLAYVILKEHFHWIIRPEGAGNFSAIMQSVKQEFTRHYKKQHNISDNLVLWQPRFWDHLIRNEGDLKRHLDYIHYNPVKHGYVAEPSRYPWSSFNLYLTRGYYPKEWGVIKPPTGIEKLNFE